MLKTIVTLFTMSALLVACGNDENSIPYRQPQGTNALPQSLEQKALSWAQGGKSLVSSLSSRNIRQETIGLNIDITNKNSENPDFKVTLSYSQSAGTCSQAVYRTKTPYETKSLSSNNGPEIEVTDFGTIKCMAYDQKNKRCDYIFVKITKTPSSVISAQDPFAQQNDGFVPAAVFITMENRSQNANSDNFIPAQLEVDGFLKIPRNESDYQFCMKPQQIIEHSSEILYPINPTGDLDQDYYYEDYYNNYGFGGFYN